VGRIVERQRGPRSQSCDRYHSDHLRDGRRADQAPTDELVSLAEKLLQVPQQLIRAALDLGGAGSS